MNIYNAIVETCSASSNTDGQGFDYGSVNIVVPPELDPNLFLNGGNTGQMSRPPQEHGNLDGQQINAGYPSYLIKP